ncbi:MAG: fibronectin type III domain-containing protein [bacterium]
MRKLCGFSSLSRRLSVLIVLALAAIGCGGDDGSPVSSEPPDDKPPADTIAPAAVTDLALRAPTRYSLALVWKAPGDDGNTGTAAKYDIRFSDAEITNDNWNQAAPVDPSQVPAPKPSGQIETFVVTSLESGVVYYFALKTSDEAGNQSDLSNCAAERTLYEDVPPSDIADLEAVASDETSFELTWTAPGDDGMSGTASQYDIRYWTRPILDDASWAEATPAGSTPSPKAPGETEVVTVTGLTPGTGYFFAVKTADDVGNWSGLSNFSAALAYGHYIFAAPKSIRKGEMMYITFGAASSGFTTMSVHAETFEPRCGEDVVSVLAYEDFPGGTRTVVYDFFHKDFGIYLPTNSYKLSVCWGPEMKEWVEVHFNNSAAAPAH